MKEVKEFVLQPVGKCHIGTGDDHVQGHCNHPEGKHHEGRCWHVTQEEFRGQQTTKQYCPCSLDHENIRRYDYPEMGYMETDIEDFMVTKKCEGCDLDLVLRLDEKLCNTCKNIEMLT